MILLIGSAVGMFQLSAAQNQPAPTLKAAEVYKNIQVLKDIPYGQVIPTMQLFTESLGVECSLCHDQKQLDSDVKPAKRVARQMLQMVYSINQSSFGGARTVTCYTCHRGKATPADDRPLRAREPAAGDTPSKTREPAQGTVAEILDRYVAAVGGVAAIQKISTMVETGSVVETRPDKTQNRLPVEIFSEAPDKRYTKGFSSTHLGVGPDSFGAYQGDEGWLREQSLGFVNVAWGSRVDAAKLEDTLNFPLRVKRLISDMRVLGSAHVGDRQVDVISGRTESLPLVKLYFDQNSGLLVRLTYETETAVEPFPTQIDYADYREVGGLKIPFRWTVTLIRDHFLIYQIDDARVNVPIDESKFIKPSSPAPVL